MCEALIAEKEEFEKSFSPRGFRGLEGGIDVEHLGVIRGGDGEERSLESLCQRQENPRQDRDDRNHRQQLRDGKSFELRL